MSSIPAEYHDRFEEPTLAHVGTLDPDGAPHATPVWTDFDAATDRVLANTERHRRKTRSVERDPRVAVSMTDPSNPYRYLSITGEVIEITTDGARDHIDDLARRYTDADEYEMDIESERVLLRIRPDAVRANG